MNDQMRGVALAIGMLRANGFDEAATWLQRTMTSPAEDSMLEIVRILTEEVAKLDELPAVGGLD